MNPFNRSSTSATLFHKSLISAQQRINLDPWEVNQRELPLETTVAWSIKKFTLHGGRQEGVQVIEVNNGKLCLVVIPTRGMSVLKIESGDVRLGWDSPVKEVVHPKFINLESRGGLGWLEGFNECVVRCGLEWMGHPGPDKFLNNVGDEVEMNLTLHGKIANIPASEVEVWIELGPAPRIHISGLVEERMFYGPKLSLWTDISTELGSTSVRFSDSLTNHGAFDQEFQILYHANFGPPLLEAGSRLVAAIDRVEPFNSHAAKSIKQYDEYGGPQPGFVEQVYCLHPLAKPDGCTEVLLKNAKSDRGVSLNFSIRELPYVTQWKNLGAAEDGYVTGIEPGTGFPANRRLEREAGRVPKLQPSEKRDFTFEVAIHPDLSSVSEAVERIGKIQGQTKISMNGGR